MTGELPFSLFDEIVDGPAIISLSNLFNLFTNPLTHQPTNSLPH